MAINFPNSPSDGQQLTEGSVTYTYNATKGYWESTESSSASSSSTTVVANMTALIALTGMSDGDQALVQATNKLYMYSGTGWYLIATIQNDAPSAITGVSGTYNLAIDGTATTITAASTDPEGFPLTWSYSTSGLGSIATVSNTDGVFTITPSTTEADAGTFTLTINATDGVNGAVSASTNLTLEFIVIVTNSRYTTLLATATGTSDNNNITDASTNNHSITVNNDAYAGTFSPYRSGGYSTYFDGNDYLTATQTNPLGTGNFTVEGWVNFDNVGGNRTLITLDDSAQLYFRNNGSSIAIYGISGGTYNFSTGTPEANTWYHFAFVRQSGSITLYWNGQSKGSVGCTDNFNSGNLHIGCWSAISEFFQGHLTDIKISNTVEYTSNFSVPTERLSSDSSTQLITCHLPYIADGSSFNETIVIGGDPSTKPFSPYDYEEYDAANHGGSVYFDGAGDRITASTSNNFAIGSSDDFIIEAWIYPTNTSQGNFHLFGIHQAIYTGGIYLDYHSSDFRIGDYGEGWDVRTTSTVPLIYNTWQHICASRTGNLIKIFFNGESLALSSQGEAHTNSYNAGAIAIGGTGVGTDFQGFISDIRFEKGTSRTSNFTPPTVPLSSTGAELHIKGTDASIVDKSQGSNLKLFGNTTGSTTQANFANTKSMYFDGTGDYITFAAGNFYFPSDFTIECWIRGSSLAGANSIVANNFGGNNGFLLWVQSNALRARLYDSSANQTNLIGSISISDNTWTHVALTRSGNTIKTFINGTQDQSGTYTDTLGDISVVSTIGAYNSGTSPLNGYIQDFRLTKGLARYTANFTPPTASLEG